MSFPLFLLLNAVLLIRPEELSPEFAGTRLYLITIVLCTAVSLPRLLEVLSPDSLRRQPVAVCVLLFFAATIVTLTIYGRLDEALFDFGPEFAKVVLYYFLFLVTVDTRERFRTFVATLVALIGVLVALALAQYYDLARFPGILDCWEKKLDPVTGETIRFQRLVSSGIFNDPNDLCLVLGIGIWSCVYLATTSPHGWAGWAFWLLPIPLYIFALLETQSRGGLLGVLAGGAAYLYSRYGGPRALPFAVAGAVLVLVLIGGRQAQLSGGTAHQRLMFWADGFSWLTRHPFRIFTGAGKDYFVGEHGHVAHNSFVEAYVEFGLLGGGAFLGAFYLGVRIIDRFGRGVEAPRWVRQARPYALALLVGYAMACYSLTRLYVIPTYLALGLASVLIDRAAPRLPERYQVSGRWFARGLLIGICGLAFFKLTTQGLGQAGI